MYSNSDHSSVESEWCEVPLGPDSVQEVPGRLQNDCRKFSEAECVEPYSNKNDVPGAASRLMTGENNDIKRSNESLAYQYGMKMLWGAAKAVSAVADGGKQNREVIKTLRADLKQTNEKYDQLQKELENSKQWVAYYENVNGGLEYQVDQNKKSYAAHVSIMQDKLQECESELDKCRKELAEAVRARDSLLCDVQKAQPSIAKTNLQVEKAHKIMAEHGRMSQTAAEYKSTNTATVQVQLDSNPDLEWQCRLNNRVAHRLYQENLELRQYIEKSNSTAYSAGYNRYRSYSTSPYNQYFTSQRQYDHYHNIQQYTYDQRRSGKRYYAQPLETITENEERSPTNCHEPSSIPQPTSLSPDTTNETSKDPIVVVSLDSPQQVPIETDITKMNKRSKRSSKKAHKRPVRRTHCLPDSGQNTASSLQTDDSNNSAVEPDEDTSTLKVPQRLFGIPMPEDVYERIIAGEDVTDWRPDVVIGRDDRYSTILCSSFPNETSSYQNNDVIKLSDSAAFAPKSTDENLHYYVTYKDVDFDMIGLTVIQIRNITTACGAIGCQSEMNAFYDFLAAKTKEMNDDPRWSGYDRLESPEDWLSLKQEAFV